MNNNMLLINKDLKRKITKNSRRYISEVLKEGIRIKYIIEEEESEKNPEEILKETFGEDMVEILEE